MVRRYFQFIMHFVFVALNTWLSCNENGHYKLHISSKYTFKHSFSYLKAFSQDLILMGQRDLAPFCYCNVQLK